MTDVQGSAEKAFINANKSRALSPVEERLVALLKDEGPLFREQLRRRIGIPRTTIYEGLAKLIARGEVTSFPFYATENLRRGRPPVLFSLIEDMK